MTNKELKVLFGQIVLSDKSKNKKEIDDEENEYIKKILADDNFYKNYDVENVLKIIYGVEDDKKIRQAIKNKFKSDFKEEFSKKREIADFFRSLLYNKISIIIGKNGIGKTRWLNSLNIDNIINISADRDIEIIKYEPLRNYLKLDDPKDFNVFLTNGKQINIENSIKLASFSGQNLHESNVYWNQLVFEKVNSFLLSKLKQEKINSYKKMIDYFYLINDDYVLNPNPFLDEWIYYKIKSKNKLKLGLENLSWGEKHLLYFLIKILDAPTNAFILIDEPELGLNEEKVVNFFKKIFTIRNDLKFIFITHSEKFSKILSLENESKIYWFKDVEIISKPNIEEVNMDINLSIYFSILCNVKEEEKILIIEGEYDSIDYNLYSKIFPNFLIFPFRGKGNIISLLAKIETNSIFNEKKIYGFVDKDGDKANRIDLRMGKGSKNIYLTKLRSIENIFYDEEFYKKYWEYIISKGFTDLNVEKINENWNKIDKILKNEVESKKFFRTNGKTADKFLNKTFYKGQTINNIINYSFENEELINIIKNKLIPEDLLK